MMAETGLFIRGDVRDATGAPIENARVFIASGPGTYPDMAIMTDPCGQFLLTVSTVGEYEVACMADGYGDGRQVVEVARPNPALLGFRLMKPE